MERSELGSVLDSGVHVGLDADEEQHTLDVRVLHRHMEEVAPFVVHLYNRGVSSEWFDGKKSKLMQPVQYRSLCEWFGRQKST